MVSQWSKEEDEVLAQVISTFFQRRSQLTPFRRQSQSMVRNGTKCKKLCRSGDTIKSDNDG